jgi:hypothetical protein
MMIHRLIRSGLGHEEILAILALAYLVIRYGLSSVFKRMSVHRGMFHSIPALLIAGLVTFMLDHHLSLTLRLFLAMGVMIGFLSHLVLDEVCSVDFLGAKLKANQFAGSALKFRSRSWVGTLTCYALLGGLGYLFWRDYGQGWTRAGTEASANLPPHSGLQKTNRNLRLQIPGR